MSFIAPVITDGSKTMAKNVVKKFNCGISYGENHSVKILWLETAPVKDPSLKFCNHEELSKRIKINCKASNAIRVCSHLFLKKVFVFFDYSSYHPSPSFNITINKFSFF